MVAVLMDFLPEQITDLDTPDDAVEKALRIEQALADLNVEHLRVVEQVLYYGASFIAGSPIEVRSGNADAVLDVARAGLAVVLGPDPARMDPELDDVVDLATATAAVARLRENSIKTCEEELPALREQWAAIHGSYRKAYAMAHEHQTRIAITALRQRIRDWRVWMHLDEPGDPALHSPR